MCTADSCEHLTINSVWCFAFFIESTGHIRHFNGSNLVNGLQKMQSCIQRNQPLKKEHPQTTARKQFTKW